jgi:hypothetical protein
VVLPGAAGAGCRFQRPAQPLVLESHQVCTTSGVHSRNQAGVGYSKNQELIGTNGGGGRLPPPPPPPPKKPPGGRFFFAYATGRRESNPRPRGICGVSGSAAPHRKSGLCLQAQASPIPLTKGKSPRRFLAPRLHFPSKIAAGDSLSEFPSHIRFDKLIAQPVSECRN